MAWARCERSGVGSVRAVSRAVAVACTSRGWSSTCAPASSSAAPAWAESTTAPWTVLTTGPFLATRHLVGPQPDCTALVTDVPAGRVDVQAEAAATEHEPVCAPVGLESDQIGTEHPGHQGADQGWRQPLQGGGAGERGVQKGHDPQV